MIYWLGFKHQTACGASRDVRKPAELFSPYLHFGFPASINPTYSNGPILSLAASVTQGEVSLNAIETVDENSLYPVFANTCRQHQEFAQAGFELANSSIEADHKNDMCYQNSQNRSKTLLGYIWLEDQWRIDQGTECIMSFMALAGRKDEQRPGEWTVTMLICLQEVEEIGRLIRYERVQIMDCEIDQGQWIEAGAEVSMITIR